MKQLGKSRSDERVRALGELAKSLFERQSNSGEDAWNWRYKESEICERVAYAFHDAWRRVAQSKIKVKEHRTSRDRDLPFNFPTTIRRIGIQDKPFILVAIDELLHTINV